MARTHTSESKEPGRLRQVWQVFLVTRRRNPASQWWILLGFAVPLLAGIALPFALGGNWFTFVMWILTGALLGLLLAMILLGRLAEGAAYREIDGQPGAVGAVLRNGLRGAWKGSEMPVAVNPKTHDAVYRAVGRTGIVLLGEGNPGRVQHMLGDERRKVERILPNVTIRTYTVGNEGDIRLARITPTLRKGKRALTRSEILAVSNRLNSLQNALPIPKGVDPLRARPQRGQMR